MIIETPLPGRMHRGKVRDTYDLGGGRLLMVATDRISAFDVVLPGGIPGKGQVLNRISGFWFDKTSHIVPNHLICLADSPDAGQYLGGLSEPLPAEVATQAMVVKESTTHRHRVHRARLHHRVGLVGVSPPGHGTGYGNAGGTGGRPDFP